MNKTKERTPRENRNVWDVVDVMEELDISRSAVYALFKREDFPSLRIGKCLKVSKTRFFDWLNAQC